MSLVPHLQSVLLVHAIETHIRFWRVKKIVSQPKPGLPFEPFLLLLVVVVNLVIEVIVDALVFKLDLFEFFKTKLYP